MNPGSFTVPHRRSSAGARATFTGVRFDPLLPFDRWTEFGVKIARYANGSPWWLGDWLVFGREKYGRRYKDAIAVTGLDYQTLRNYAVVARRFSMSRRRDNVSFQHHAEVCTLCDEQQDHWLGLAARNRWSRNELRRELRKATAAADAGHQQCAALRITCERENLERWRQAAACSGVPFELWVPLALDLAARAALGDPAET